MGVIDVAQAEMMRELQEFMWKEQIYFYPEISILVLKPILDHLRSLSEGGQSWEKETGGNSGRVESWKGKSWWRYLE